MSGRIDWCRVLLVMLLNECWCGCTFVLQHLPMCVCVCVAVCVSVCVFACARFLARVCCNVPVFTRGILPNRRNSVLLRIDFSPICLRLLHTLLPVHLGKGAFLRGI